MQILVNKKGRTVKLTKREDSLLKDAERLLIELATSGGGGIGQAADDASGAIASTIRELACQGEEVVNPPY